MTMFFSCWMDTRLTNVPFLEKGKENHVNVLLIPSHTSLQLQPLDVSFIYLLSSASEQAYVPSIHAFFQMKCLFLQKPPIEKIHEPVGSPNRMRKLTIYRLIQMDHVHQKYKPEYSKNRILFLKPERRTLRSLQKQVVLVQKVLVHRHFSLSLIRNLLGTMPESIRM